MNIDTDFDEYLKEFKEFDGKMESNVTLSKQTKNKWDKFGVYFQLKILENQISTMKSYNLWFKSLTAIIIILTIINIYVAIS